MSIFPTLNSKEGPSGQIWFWEKDTVMDVPRLDAKTALMFSLAKDYLSPVLPKAALNELRPHFQQAERTLAEIRERSYSQWPDKVRVIQNSIQLHTPEIEETVLNKVYDALFVDKKTRIHYQTRGGEEDTYIASLRGLVFRDGYIYAVCSLEGKDHIRQLPIHRMSSVEILDEYVEPISGFSLDRYVKTFFDYPLRELKSNSSNRDQIDEKITISIALDALSAVHLRESPLSLNQKNMKLPDGRESFTATVANTERLRWWILSYGQQMEVLSPVELRTEIRDKLKRAGDLYK